MATNETAGGFDTVNGYIYWVTFFAPSKCIKTQPTAGSLPIARVAALTFTDVREIYASAIALDTIKSVAYIAFWGRPGDTGRYVVITTPSGSTAPSRSSIQNLNANFSFPTTMVIDLTRASLLIGCNTIPGTDIHVRG